MSCRSFVPCTLATGSEALDNHSDEVNSAIRDAQPAQETADAVCALIENAILIQ